MNEIKDVTGTAFIVAEFRASENVEAKPLYVDPVVPIFFDDRTRQAADSIAGSFPAGVKNVKIRTRYLDDMLDLQIANGCRQIVILGAGLDTRAVRKQAPGVVYYEIDDAKTLRFKQERLEAAGYRAADIFILGNYVEQGVLPLLEANGFDRDEPAFFIWEGNTISIQKNEPECFGRVAGRLARLQHRFRLYVGSGHRLCDRRGGYHQVRRALRGDGCAVGVRHRRSPGVCEGCGLDCRRQCDDRRAASSLLARATLRHAHVRSLLALHAELGR